MPVAAVIIWEQADNAHHFIPEDPFVISFQFVVRPDYSYCGIELKYQVAQRDNELSLHEGNWVPIPLTALGNESGTPEIRVCEVTLNDGAVPVQKPTTPRGSMEVTVQVESNTVAHKSKVPFCGQPVAHNLRCGFLLSRSKFLPPFSFSEPPKLQLWLWRRVGRMTA